MRSRNALAAGGHHYQVVGRHVDLGQPGRRHEQPVGAEPRRHVAVLAGDEPPLVQPPADGDDRVGEGSRAHPAGARRWTTRPPTMVHTGRPRSSCPAYGELRPFDTKRAGSTRHVAAGSNTVTSATAPWRSDPPSRWNSRAGATAIRSTSVA